MMTEEAIYEEAINRTYPGLQMFVRDADLPESLLEKYTSGAILREKGFTDVSCRVTGMAVTHRYAILSNHMADLRKFERGTNWGLFVAQRDSHFKVLGKDSFSGKTAVFLLHLPDDESWKLFRDTAINFDSQLLESCVQRFESKCCEPPAPELAGRDWLERCAFPIGLDSSGTPFPLE